MPLPFRGTQAPWLRMVAYSTDTKDGSVSFFFLDFFRQERFYEINNDNEVQYIFFYPLHVILYTKRTKIRARTCTLLNKYYDAQFPLFSLLPKD